MSEDYYKGLYESKSDEYGKLNERLGRWITAFSWTMFALVMFVLILVISALTQSPIEVGYTPEQVTEIALNICKEFREAGL